MITKLTAEQVASAASKAQDGHSVTLMVCKMLPTASESAIDREIERVYDAMEYPEHQPA
jgi:hypothetical protein